MRLALALVLLLHGAPVAAQLASSGLVDVGGMRGGRAQAIAHFAGYAYVAADHVLNVLDASDPTDLSLVRSIPVEPVAGGNAPRAIDVEVHGASELLFVAMQDDGMWVYSLTDPSDPVLVERRTDLGTVTGLDQVTDKLFAFTDEGIAFFSLSDPTDPKPAGLLVPNVLPITIPVDPVCYDVTRGGGYVFTMWNRRDYDPPLPQLIVYPDESEGVATAVASALYFTNPGDGDVIFDGQNVFLASGFRNVLLSTFDVPTGDLQYVANLPMKAEEILKIGNRLHAFGQLTYEVYEISNPATPFRLASVELSGRVREARLVGGRVWVAVEESGVEVYDVSSTVPQRVGDFWYPTGPSDMQIVGDRLYLADNPIMVLDRAADVQSPPVVDIEVVDGYYGFINALSVDEDAIAYLPDAGLLTVDLADPATSSVLGQLSVPAQTLGIARDGDVAYVASLGSGFLVADVAVPESPQLLYDLQSTQIRGFELDVWADHLYLAGTVSNSPVLAVFDVTDPSAPVLRTQFASPGGIQDVEVAQGHLYVAGFGGTAIYDLGDPADPVHVTTIPTTEGALCVDVLGHRLVVGDGDVVRVYDVRDPANPIETAFHEMVDVVHSIAQEGPLIYVGVQSSGLHTLLGDAPTGVSTPPPSSLAVSARPNPMSERATLSFRLDRDDVARIELFDVAGRRVRTWTRSATADVPVLVAWDGRDDAGHDVASGTYFYRVVTSRAEAAGRVVVVR